jgi:hypothetical protein
MAKAQVLVTVTAEALVDLPDGVDDVESYCRERISLDWSRLEVESLLQAPTIAIEHLLVEAEAAQREPVADAAGAEEAPAEVASAVDVAPDGDLVALFDERAYRDIDARAVRDRATRLLEEVVADVVAEFEPILRRHYGRGPSAAS